MSTKTLRKRIALVAVASLGFGLMSTVPAFAGIADITGGAVTVQTAVAQPVDAFKIPFTLSTTAAVTVNETAGVTVTTISKPAGSSLVCSATSGGTYDAAGCSTANTVYAFVATANAADVKLARTTDTKIVTGWIWAKVDKPGTYTFTVGVTGTDAVPAALTATSANATFTLSAVNSVPTYTNTTTTIAGRVGQQVSIDVTANIAANDLSATADGQYQVIGTAAAITSQPATPAGGAVVYPTLAATAESGAAVKYDKAVTGDGAGSATNVAVKYLASNLSDENILARTGLTVGTVTFTPSVKGVYTLVVWNETSSTAVALSGAESFQTFTINVVDAISTVSVSAINSTSAVDGSLAGDDYGSLVKVSLKDAAGNIAIPATGESVVLTPSGAGDITYVNNVAVASTAGAAYSLAASAFGNTGTAWVNIASATAETFTVVATYTGSASASVSLTSRTPTASATSLAPKSFGLTGFADFSGTTTGTVNYPRGTATATFSLDNAYAATTYNAVLVTDTLGAITGVAGLQYAPAATVSTDIDGLGTDGVLFSVTWTASSTADTASIFTINTLTGTQRTTTVSSVATAAGTATATPGTINAVPGATTTVNVTLKDNFGRAFANQTMSASVTGRNPTLVNKTALTDSLGNASFTFTDANTTSVITSDSISVTGGSAAKTVTVLYGTANAPSTITLTSTGDTDVIAGTTKTDIDASATGATGTSATASAVVKNSAGSAVAGVAVTFTVTGLVGAEVHTTKATVYTDATGKAVSNISSYAAGKATVTATAGTATASDDIYFSQQTPGEARTIAMSATGGLVKATVKDRYGNVIEGVVVNATRTGTGYFGAGASTATGNTDANGEVEFNFVGSGTVKVAFSSATYGQSYAAAGYDLDAVNGTAITASAAGTSATNQKGLGGSLSPAGINSASLAVEGINAAETNASAAADAAAEATDAANAATDAANAAAEAADAATAAAQDAADAVAALSTQVSEMVNALKKQITALTNLVIKIQKKVKA
jgi:trimeric autotransporter adhesin